MEQEQHPQYLYKILSYPHWEESQTKGELVLPADDAAFIHFSTEIQVERIQAKYWSDVARFVVLTVAVQELEGELVYETNPGGETKYYHLYAGRIPLKAVVSVQVVCQEPVA